MLSECLVVRCNRCDNGVLSNLERIEPHVRVPPPAPTGRCILFTMANRLPWLTNLSMHDSANIQRCSIDRLLQGGQVALPNRCDAEQPGARRNSRTRFPKRHPSGNRVPLSRRIPGYRFPMGPLGETASQNSGSKRDMVSQTSLLRKMQPGIPARNGTHFPSRGPMGNCIPESAPKPGRSFRTGHQRQSCGGIVPAWAG